MGFFQHDENQHLLPIYCLGIDMNNIQDPVDRPFGYPSYQLTLCLDGQGVFIDENGTEHIIEMGDLFYFSPNTPHKYFPTTQNWKCPYIVFTGNCANNLTAYLQYGNSFVIKNNDFEKTAHICDYLNKIYYLYFNKDETTAKHCSVIIYALLVHISDLLSSPADSADNKCSKRLLPVLSYIRRHISEDISVADLASVINTSPNRLSVMFRQVYGVSPIKFVLSYKIDISKLYMRAFPNMTIKEISKIVGFTTPSYFMTAFKKATGLSPSEYKNNSNASYLW